MTAPFTGRVDSRIVSAVKRMKDDAFYRDESIRRVLEVRRGRFSNLWPDAFSERYPEAMVANFVDVAARDFAANLSPLPSLACSAGNMRTDADKRRAEKKNRIGSNYWRTSRMQTQMKYGADQWLTYGFLPVWVEADYDRHIPIIHIEDPNGAYYDLDRWLDTVRYARVWRQNRHELAALFPELAHRILDDGYGRDCDSNADTEVVRFVDKYRCILYLPELGDTVLADYAHKQKDARGRPRCPVHVALRPGVEVDPRGQFDDVLWVQLAHAVMTALTVEAGHKAVQAPLAVPSDMQEISIGPDAVMTTDNPEKIQRVPLQVPAAAFELNQTLQQEMQFGAATPDSRLGVGPPGGSTGRGISALQGGWDSQIRLGQDVLGEMLRITTEMCFQMEVELWPNRMQSISGTLSGESFQLTYKPTADLAGDTQCEVSYGFASGLSPNAAIVTLLQLRGDEIIGRDTFRRQLPFDINVDQQQRELDVQKTEDGLMQGLLAGLQATGQMIAQGQIGPAMQFFTAAGQVIDGRRKGRDLAELILTAFQPPPAQPAPPGQAGPPGAPGGAVGPNGEPLDGVGPNGLPSGVAPGQAGMAPGGRPSLQDLTAGFTGAGAPNMGDTIHRKIATS